MFAGTINIIYLFTVIIIIIIITSACVPCGRTLKHNDTGGLSCRFDFAVDTFHRVLLIVTARCTHPFIRPRRQCSEVNLAAGLQIAERT